MVNFQSIQALGIQQELEIQFDHMEQTAYIGWVKLES